MGPRWLISLLSICGAAPSCLAQGNLPLPPHIAVVDSAKGLYQNTIDGSSLCLVPRQESEFEALAQAGPLPPVPAQVTTGCFLIGRDEVTVGRFRRFASVTGYRPTVALPSDDLVPITGLALSDVTAYLSWCKSRLPSEAQWDLAVLGAGATLPRQGEPGPFPWGGVSSGRSRMNCSVGDEFTGLSPPGSFVDGVSPFGLNDGYGNAEELVLIWEDEPGYMACRGGSFASPCMFFSQVRREVPRDSLGDRVGFRICVPLQ